MPPVNDNFASAIDITGPLAQLPYFVASTGEIDESISGATLESGEQNSTPVVGVGTPTMSMFWTFTLVRRGTFSVQLLQALPTDGRLELWKGTSLGGLILQKTWRTYPILVTDETAGPLGAGTYYVRAASTDAIRNVQFRYRISYTSITVHVGVLNPGDSIPALDARRKASAVVFMGNGVAADTSKILNAIFGGGAATADLTQFGGSWARLKDTPPSGSTTPGGAASMVSGKAWSLVDPLGTILQEFTVTAFNDDGSIDLGWSVSGAGKVGYFVIYDVEAAIQYATWSHTVAFPNFTSDWPVRGMFGFGAYKVPNGSGGGAPNDGVAHAIWSSIAGAFGAVVGVRESRDTNPHITELTAVGIEDDGSVVNYMDGGGRWEGFAPDDGPNDGVTFTFVEAIPGALAGRTATDAGLLHLGGLGWYAPSRIYDPSTQFASTSNPNHGFKMAGGLSEVDQGTYNDAEVDPSYSSGSLNPTSALQMGAWDIGSNQFTVDARVRSWQQSFFDGPPFGDAVYVSWRGFYSDRIGFTTYAVPDTLAGDTVDGWYEELIITDEEHGVDAVTNVAGAQNPAHPPNNPTGWITFGTKVSIDLTKKRRPQIIRYRP